MIGLGGSPDPVHPRVGLDVDPKRGVRPRQGINEFNRVRSGGQLPFADVRHGIDSCFGKKQDGGVDACLAESDPFLNQRYCQPARSGFEGNSSHGSITVPVGVCLDDGAQHRRTDQFREMLDVSGNRAEVDLGIGGSHHA